MLSLLVLALPKTSISSDFVKEVVFTYGKGSSAIPKNAVVAVEAKDRTMVSLRKLGSDFTPRTTSLDPKMAQTVGKEHARDRFR